MATLHPKKLLLSKWTAVKPLAKQKHFLVCKVIEPEPPEAPVEWIDSQLLYTLLSMGLAKCSQAQGHQADQCLAKHQAPPPHLDAGWDGP